MRLYPVRMTSPQRFPTRIGWRLLALLYDFFPVLALWFIAAGIFTLAHGDAVRGGWLGWLEFVVLWLIAGLYAVLSWRRGGQTIGMRAWRLRVSDVAGQPAHTRALWLRFAIGSVSLLALGLGVWWAWLDREGLTLHDRFSSTRMTRLPKA